MKEVIFTKGDFTLVKESGIGTNNTPWEGLNVISEGNADKHAVEVRLVGDHSYNFDGKPVKYTYNNENSIYIAHGMRGRIDTFSDTKEYIEVLQDALQFAERVKSYIENTYNNE